MVLSDTHTVCDWSDVWNGARGPPLTYPIPRASDVEPPGHAGVQESDVSRSRIDDVLHSRTSFPGRLTGRIASSTVRCPLEQAPIRVRSAYLVAGLPNQALDSIPFRLPPLLCRRRAKAAGDSQPLLEGPGRGQVWGEPRSTRAGVAAMQPSYGAVALLRHFARSTCRLPSPCLGSARRFPVGALRPLEHVGE